MKSNLITIILSVALLTSLLSGCGDAIDSSVFSDYDRVEKALEILDTRQRSSLTARAK